MTRNTAPSSNWKALKEVLGTTGRLRSSPSELPPVHKGKRKRTEDPDASIVDGAPDEAERSPDRRPKASRGDMVPVQSILDGGTAAWQKDPGRYLALDCEMVGVGPGGSESSLARVSIVNFHGVTILDRFVRQREKVTDYRTWVSGVREEDLVNAPPFTQVQKEVASLLNGRILVGHALSNDTQALLLSHPWNMTRDTSTYPPLRSLAKTSKPSLKRLAKLVLGIDVQSGEHSSVIDARVTMCIYRSQKKAWEDSLVKHTTPTLVLTSTPSLKALSQETFVSSGRGAANVEPSVNSVKGRNRKLALVETLQVARAQQGSHNVDSESTGTSNRELIIKRELEKVKQESEEGIVLGFDFLLPGSPPQLDASSKSRPPVASMPSNKKQKKPFKGDMDKRPKSKESWWEET